MLESAYMDTDVSAPWSPPDVIRMQYPGNDAGNGATGGSIWQNGTWAFKQLYMCAAIKVDDTYVTHSNGEKFWYPIHSANNNGSALGFRPVNGQTPTSGAFGVELNTQDALSPVPYEQPAGPYLQKGTWQMCEVYYAMNTPGLADGACRVWINGTLVLDMTSIGYSTDAAVWTTMRWAGARGGGASTVLTPPNGQRRYYDRLTVYGSVT